MQRLFLLLILGCPIIGFAQVDTLAAYLNLLNYNGSADSVYISHSRYHGLFVKGACSTSDFGTSWVVGGDCWQRVHSNYSPRFWELNGPNPGNLFGNVVEEADAINAAAWAAWNAGGDTIEIDSMYAIDRQLLLYHGNTYLGMNDSAGFVRADPPKTMLTDTAHQGDAVLHVASNAGFRDSHRINIASAVDYDSIPGHAGYTAAITIAGGADSIIHIGPALAKTMLPGDSVSLFFPMMKGSSDADTDSVILKNLVFDGNRSQYTLSVDWRVNTAVQFPTSSGAIIEQCRFYNMPAENMFVCGTTVRDCSGDNFNGSALHFSCNPGAPPTEITYNDFSNLNEAGDSLMAHSEGGFTASAKVRNFTMAYNTLTNIHEHGMGRFGNDDTNMVITDNVLHTTKDRVNFLAFYLYPETNTIYNNKNTLDTDTSTGPCVVVGPQPVDANLCNANSTPAAPLTAGDTITITLDSLQLRNSSENYLKQIVPLFADEYFAFAGANVSTLDLAPYHGWTVETTSGMEALTFDNGHRNGIDGNGNWGYEGCGLAGGCTELELQFVVTDLPEITTQVSCPLQGIELVYDGEHGTWDEPVLCQNPSVAIDSTLLGRPFLQGSSCHAPINLRNDQHTLNSVRLRWDTLAHVDRYRVWYKPTGSSPWIKVGKAGNQGRKVLTGLSPFTQYKWMVQARCDSMWGPLSVVGFFETDTTTCSPVNTTSLNTSGIQTDKARVTWTTTTTSDGYELRWRPDNQSVWQDAVVSASRAKRWLTNLVPGTAYEWQIRSRCQNGSYLSYSAWSAMQTFTTQSDTSAKTSKQPAPATLLPNPATAQVQVTAGQAHIQAIRVVSLTGQTVAEYTNLPHRNRFGLAVSHLPRGAYVVLVQTPESSWQQLLLLE